MAIDAFARPAGPEGDAVARSLLAELWRGEYDPAADPFISSYASPTTVTLTLAPGVSVTLPLGRDAIGLALGELLQEAGDLAAATAVVEALEPSRPAAVSLAELYTAQARWDEVVELTNQPEASDDLAVFLSIQRGIALRENGYPQAGREVLKSVTSRRTIAATLRHRALIERANCYLSEGKRSLARKDLERVLAEDAAYPDLQQAVDQLG